MPNIIDSLFAYKFIKLLAKPFSEWKAYKMGIIDEKGNVIRQPKTTKEKLIWNKFAILVRNMKRILEKTPLGRYKTASILVALKLLKEETGEDYLDILLERYPDTLDLDNTHPLLVESGEYWHDTDNSYKVLNKINEYHGFPVYKVKNLLTGEETIAIPVTHENI